MAFRLIHDAAQRGDLQAIQQELDKGAYVNLEASYGWTPLHFAMGKKSTIEVVKFLISRKANVDALDDWGWSPLMMTHSDECCDMLLEAKADLSIRSTKDR